MPFDWKKYLSFSTDLVAEADLTDKAEEKYRISISRAYYSIFNPIKLALVTQIGPIPRGKKTHRWVIEQLEERGRHDDDHKQAAIKLSRMQLRRETADYEGHFNPSGAAYSTPEAIARDTIKQVGDIYDLLGSIQTYR